MQAFRILICSGFATAGLMAQSGIGGPVSGIVYDREAARLRQILGIPGASVMGGPIELGYELKLAAVAPRQDAAIAVAADDTLHLLRLNGGPAAERTLEGISVIPERVVFSPSGTAAALYRSGALQVISRLPDAPAVAAFFDLSAYEAPGSLALSDDGAFLLFTADGALRVLSTRGDDRKLMDAGEGALAAFAPGTHDAAVLDASGLVLLRDAGGNAEPQPVAAAGELIDSPSGLAFSADGVKILVAGARGVAWIDPASGTRGRLSCGCTLSALARMGGMFRLNEPGSGPLWLLDAEAAEPRIVFVPARKVD
jgi:hypothetical protein